jgi:hypothetical protein
VFTVFWNASVPNQSELGTFYGTIVNSPYVDWLREYNTPTQTIGRGSFIGSYVDPSPPSAKNLSDDAIRQELGKLIDNGALPRPDADTLFMVHFPAGVSISMSSATSCQQFCAYHSSFVHGDATVYYGIIPDFSGARASCGEESTPFASTTVVASHEVAEAMTDPNIGVAIDDDDEHQLAWYDDQNGEIGDVCEGQNATVAGYRVTMLWSNKENACIATDASAGPGGGGTGDGDTGGGGPPCSHSICEPGAPRDRTRICPDGSTLPKGA